MLTCLLDFSPQNVGTEHSVWNVRILYYCSPQTPTGNPSRPHQIHACHFLAQLTADLKEGLKQLTRVFFPSIPALDLDSSPSWEKKDLLPRREELASESRIVRPTACLLGAGTDSLWWNGHRRQGQISFLDQGCQGREKESKRVRPLATLAL